MQLRPAGPRDVDAIVEVVNDAYRREGGWTTEAHLLGGQRTDAAAVRDVLDHLTVAVEGGEVVGCCALTPYGDHASFGMFAVRPGLQGGGVGAALLAEAERVAAEQGAAYVELTVLAGRSELLAFYERRGYVPTGATEPFPYGDERFGLPRRGDLVFLVLRKPVGSARRP